MNGALLTDGFVDDDSLVAIANWKYRQGVAATSAKATMQCDKEMLILYNKINVCCDISITLQ